MGRILKRLLDIKLPRGRSAFLWGPRRVGKTYWIRQNFPEAPLIDLLKSDVYAEYAAGPLGFGSDLGQHVIRSL